MISGAIIGPNLAITAICASFNSSSTPGTIPYADSTLVNADTTFYTADAE